MTTKWRDPVVRLPCEVCRRIHPGKCVAAEQRSVRFTLSLPGGVMRLLRERVPWGERSGWVARLIERELETCPVCGWPNPSTNHAHIYEMGDR